MVKRKRKMPFKIWTMTAFIAAVATSQLEAQTTRFQNGPNYGPVRGPVLVSAKEPRFFQDQDKKDPAKEPDANPGAKEDEDTKKDAEGKSDTKSDAEKSAKSGLAPITMQSVRDPIGAPNISVSEIGTKVLPANEAGKERPETQALPGGAERGFSYVNYRWQAANNSSLPLYFEEPMLERHGQQICPTCLQPAVSGTKFLSNLLLYPYKATLQPALECRYTLGHFRPGSATPCLRDTLPWSPRAALVEGMAITGVAVGLPW